MRKNQLPISPRHLLLGVLLGVLAIRLCIRIKQIYPSIFQTHHHQQQEQMVSRQQATDVNERVVLPTNVKPVHYDLELHPDMEKFVFEGKVAVK